MIFIKFF